MNFQDKWLVRLRDVLGRYVAFQYCYISILYLYNIPLQGFELNGREFEKKPDPIRFRLVPNVRAKFVETDVSALSLRHLLCHAALLVGRDSDKAPTTGFVGGQHVTGEITQERKRMMTGEQMTRIRNHVKRCVHHVFLSACATVFVHVRNSLGDRLSRSCTRVPWNSFCWSL